MRAQRILLFLLLPVSPALADTLSGTVVDADAAPVPGCDIDAIDQQTGDELDLSNDGTDSTGFFSVEVPPGVYTVILTPPPPPTTTHLRVTLEDVVVVGSEDLGTITLPPGFALSGRVLDHQGFPVAGLDLDVVDVATGEDVDPLGDETDNFGRFTMAVPTTPIELELRPDEGDVPLLAPEVLPLDLDRDTDLGDLQLELGYVLSATVQRASDGTPVQGADMDVHDAFTGDKRFTPKDNTDSSGFVDVVVPVGTYEVELCAPLSMRLVTVVLGPFTVTGDRSLGTVQMPAGVILSGSVKSASSGGAIAQVDVDVRDLSTGLKIPLCGSHTDGSGQYATVVPTGTYDLMYEPSFDQPYGSETVESVTITGDHVQDAFLPDCGCASRFGTGVAGTGGIVPRLKTLGGCLRTGNPDLRVRLTRGRGGATALLIAGVAGEPAGTGGTLGIGGGRLLLAPTVIVLSGTDGAAGEGEGGVALPLPDDSALAGLTLRIRGSVLDPQALGGRAIPRPLEGQLCE